MGCITTMFVGPCTTREFNMRLYMVSMSMGPHSRIKKVYQFMHYSYDGGNRAFEGMAWTFLNDHLHKFTSSSNNGMTERRNKQQTHKFSCPRHPESYFTSFILFELCKMLRSAINNKGNSEKYRKIQNEITKVFKC